MSSYVYFELVTVALTDVMLRMFAGVTQDQIDFLRGTTERDMLADMQQLFANGASLEAIDRHGATPVRFHV